MENDITLLDMMDDGSYDHTLMESVDLFLVDQYIEEFREATFDLLGGSTSFDFAVDQIVDL
jgi:hypothetical protein